MLKIYFIQPNLNASDEFKNSDFILLTNQATKTTWLFHVCSTANQSGDNILAIYFLRRLMGFFNSHLRLSSVQRASSCNSRQIAAEWNSLAA